MIMKKHRIVGYSLLIPIALLASLLLSSALMAAPPSEPPIPEAVLQAAAHHIAMETAFIPEWEGAAAVDPVAHYDLQGEISAYVFSVVKDGKPAGSITVSMKEAGYPIVEFYTKGTPRHVHSLSRSQALARAEGLILGKPLYLGALEYDFELLNRDGLPAAGAIHAYIINMDSGKMALVERSALSKWPTPRRRVTAKDINMAASRIIIGVPDYDQFRYGGCYVGCGPTAAGCIMGYWDDRGYDNLIAGGNSRTGDWQGTIKSLNYYMHTSCGATYYRDIAPGIEDFVNSRGYRCRSRWISPPASTYSEYMSEIDSRHPLEVGVQDHEIYGNHAVTGVGYQTAGQYMIIHDNWPSTPKEIYIKYGSGYSRIDFFTVRISGSRQPTPTPIPTPIPSLSQVAFQSDRASDWEIYKMRDNGYYQEKLTNNSADDISPAFSPDGEEIVFASNRDGDWEIYKMRSNGSSQRKLTDNEADDISPAFSPDGEEIAFASDRDGDWEIYKMRSNGSSQRKLTDNEAADVSPSWSPDGGWIAFQSDRDGDWEVYKMNARGYYQKNLTDSEADDASPTWWPYCDWIFFQTDRDGNWEIYRMDARGYHQENLTDSPADDMIDNWAAPPAASFNSNSPQCLCTAIQFTDTTTGGSPPYTYDWDFGDGIGTSTLQNPSYHYADAGTYNVTLMVTDINGLPDTTTGQVTVYPNPIADAGPDKEISKGDSTVIGGSPTASGGTSPYTYVWKPTTGLDDPTKANPTASPLTTTTYTVQVTDANGCRETDDVVVTVTHKIFLPIILKSYPAGT